MSDMFLIWSHEHCAWWGPDRCGYVRSVSRAGRYTHAEAMDICASAIPGTARTLGALPELPVREDDVAMMRHRFRGQFPDVAKEPWE